jgi:glycosyltransferase involved in cell wall biosynthesis
MLSALVSMPKQSELLVWLDGCTDGTKDVVRAITDRRVKFFESQEKLGQGIASNELLARASGEFVARLDADDVCIPGRFRLQLKVIQKKGWDIIVGGAIKFRLEKLSFKPSFPLSLDSNEFNHSLVVLNSAFHSTMVVRKSSLTEDLKYEKRKGAEDYMFLLNAAIAGLKIGSIPFPLIMYRLHIGQITAELGYEDLINEDGYLYMLRSRLSRKLSQAQLPVGNLDHRSEIKNFLASAYFSNFFNGLHGLKRHWFKSKLKRAKL